MARSLRSLFRFAGVFRHQVPLRHVTPLASSASFFPVEQRGSVAQDGAWVRFMSDDHTAKWMQSSTGTQRHDGSTDSWSFDKVQAKWIHERAMRVKWCLNSEMKSPMELINEVPPIKVDARVVACEGGTDPALGHPIEFISLDGAGPAVCKYCGLRYYQGDSHGHH